MGLIARSVGYTYGHGTRFAVEALQSVDVSVDAGELVVVTGATGSGKSTLLRLLAGLLEPTAGAVTADGAAVSGPEARGRVAIVFQNSESQFFAESVLDDVAFGPRNLHAHDPSAVAEMALDAVGLDPAAFGARSPFLLSGGEARRVAIAGALAMGAPYLLLDEPTAGLDARGRADVREVIARERARAGVVVVTHDPEEFLATADRVLALQGGTVVFAGGVVELYESRSVYERAGLRLPEIVMVQLLARERGMPSMQVSLDPEEVAGALAAWRRVSP